MCDFILQTGHPLSIVGNKHFIKMLDSFDSKYKFSTRQRFSFEIMPLKFKSFKIKVTHLINEAEFCHLATDGWTSQASHSYIGATIHFADQNFYSKSIRISLIARVGNTGIPVFETIYSYRKTGIKKVEYRYFGFRNNFTIRKLKKFKILIDLINGNKTHRTKLNVSIYIPIPYMILVIFS